MKQEKPIVMRWVLAGMGGLLVVLLLAYTLQDFVRTVIVLPGSYLIWLLRTIFNSLPQILFWGVLIVFAFVLFYKSLTKKSDPPISEENKELMAARRSRFSFWRLQLYHRSDISNNRLIEFIDRLVLEVLSFVYSVPAWQVEKRIENREIEVPNSLESYLIINRQVPAVFPVTWYRVFLRVIRPWLQRIRRSPTESPPQSSDQELEEIIHYLEEQLEIHHESNHI